MPMPMLMPMDESRPFAPGLVLLLTSHAADEPDMHQLLTLDVGSPDGTDASNPPKVPAACSKLEGSFDIDDEVAHLSGPFLYAQPVAPWGVALASHRKAWDNQVCVVRCPGGEGSEEDDERKCCVLEIEDDRCVPSVPLAGADEDNNYVVSHGGQLSLSPHHTLQAAFA